MNKFLFSASLILSTLLCFNANAQLKIGYINSEAILYSMPEEKVMEETLKKKSDEYQAALEKMYADYGKSVEELQAKGNTLSEPIKETMMKDLANRERTIKEFEEKAQEDLQKLQGQLLQPIQDKANTAVKAVAKENGYTWVFDLASGSIVSAPDGDDLTPLVKKKLGIL